MRYLITHGMIIDPSQRVATIGHILIENGKVARMYEMTDRLPDADQDLVIIDAHGCLITPGFTDLHVHLREPGEEHKETIATGTHAAARGGFTTICAMPNTRPAYDTPAVVRHVRQMAREVGMVQVEVIGAATVGRQGRTLSDMANLVEAGCIAFSDDGSPISDPAVMRNALAYSRMLDVPIMSHCEDTRLNAGWAMHEGAVSMRLGLPGYPAAAEEVQIARDINLAAMTGGHLHVCHVSTAGGVELIRHARKRGIRVTAEVSPHHLTLTDRWVLGTLDAPPSADQGSLTQRLDQYSHIYAAGMQSMRQSADLPLPAWLNPTLLPPFDPSTRVSPPLRTEADVEALIAGLADGTLDAIATDHAPHALVDKQCEYGLAACGISGLETALGLVLTLVHRGALDILNAIACLTEGPARVLKRSPSSLRIGTQADLVIIDPDHQWIVDVNQFASKGKNSPLHGQRLKGRVMLTMVAGQIVHQEPGFGMTSRAMPVASRLEGILNTDDDDG